MEEEVKEDVSQMMIRLDLDCDGEQSLAVFQFGLRIETRKKFEDQEAVLIAMAD